MNLWYLYVYIRPLLKQSSLNGDFLKFFIILLNKDIQKLHKTKEQADGQEKLQKNIKKDVLIVTNTLKIKGLIKILIYLLI
ncbi:hypothetical protein [Bacillus vallismortis]|uniref:hypothetical protein n=1 Tax=Bacillus vallismortis TaxID=72361 RepID=UPI0027A531C0|nr:hypothetical protein P5652_09535 [Bacillus subtilis]WGD68757.1 hypothetical protein P5630_14645 [Bacillus subtilis]WGD74243.1 hypothetical protein P5668_08790 [Bacillus subtilis]